jgi:hypothetical protein
VSAQGEERNSATESCAATKDVDGHHFEPSAKEAGRTFVSVSRFVSAFKRIQGQSSLVSVHSGNSFEQGLLLPGALRGLLQGGYAMVLLKPPECVDQRIAHGQVPNEDCGEACASSILTDIHYPGPHAVRDIEAFAQAHRKDVSDGTGVWIYHTLFQQYEVPHQLHQDVPQADWLLPALEHKHECMVAIHSDSAGNPTPHSPIGHWVLVYGFDGATYHFMNPYGGHLQTCTAELLKDSAQNIGLEITTVLPKDKPNPSPQPGEDPPLILSLALRTSSMVPSRAQSVGGRGSVCGRLPGAPSCMKFLSGRH